MIENLQSLPQFHEVGPCIYFLLDGDEVVYVGKSLSLSQRLNTHIKGGHKDWDRVHYYEVKDTAALLVDPGVRYWDQKSDEQKMSFNLGRLERPIIKILDPKFNRETRYTDPSPDDLDLLWRHDFCYLVLYWEDLQYDKRMNRRLDLEMELVEEDDSE